MNTKAMSHTHDPETSTIAARKVSQRRSARVRRAIVHLLAEKPRTDDELVAAYRSRAETERWPLLPVMHEVKRRRSDMHTRFHVVKPSTDDYGNKTTRPSTEGNPSTVWTLAVPADQARQIVGLT